MRRFCSVCGKGTERLVEGLCQECFCAERDLLKLPREVEIKVCRTCLRYWSKGRWLEAGRDMEEALENASEREVTRMMQVEDLEERKTKVDVERVTQKGKGTFHVICAVGVEGRVDGMVYAKRKEVLVRARLRQCDRCSRTAGGYFEAILQVRGEGLSEKEKNEILESVASDVGSSSGEGSFISKSKVLRNGVDIYMGSLRATRKVAANLRERYGGRLNESPKLVGRDKSGKDIYRVSVLIRLPSVRKGDVLHAKGREVRVEKITGNMVSCTDVKSGGHLTVPLRVAEKARKRN